MRTVIRAEKLWDGTRLTAHPIVIIEDGILLSLGTRETGSLLIQPQ